MALLNEIPEYKHSIAINTGPKVILGAGNRETGKILFEMTKRTSEDIKQVYDKIYEEKRCAHDCLYAPKRKRHFAKVKENNINVVIAGHI